MKFYLNTLAILVLACGSFSVYADDSLIEPIQARLSSIKCVAGDFRQERVLSILPVPLESNGNYQYCLSAGLNWKTLHPVETEFAFDANGKPNDPVETNLPGSKEFFEIFVNLFSGDMDVIEKQFSIEASAEGELWELILVPKSRIVAEYIDHIRLLGKETIEYLEVVEAAGDETRINFDVSEIQRVN